MTRLDLRDLEEAVKVLRSSPDLPQATRQKEHVIARLETWINEFNKSSAATAREKGAPEGVIRTRQIARRSKKDRGN